MTRLVLIRHGHVAGIDPPHFRGRTELALTALGRRQSAAAAARIAAEHRPAVIYSSPIGRCQETAGAIAAACHAPVETAPELIDCDYGAWQGSSHAEIGARDPQALAEWYAAPQRTRFPGGDSLQDLALRAADFLRRVVRGHADATVVAVGHASINEVLLLDILDMPLASYWRLSQDPCAISVADLLPGRWRLRLMNDVSHLAGLDLDR